MELNLDITFHFILLYCYTYVRNGHYTPILLSLSSCPANDFSFDFSFFIFKKSRFVGFLWLFSSFLDVDHIFHWSIFSAYLTSTLKMQTKFNFHFSGFDQLCNAQCTDFFLFVNVIYLRLQIHCPETYVPPSA